MYYLPQLGQHDCGIACLKMILASLNRDRTYLFLKANEKHGPYSFKELIEIASEHHLSMTGMHFDNKEEIVHSLYFPMIIPLKRNGALHSVILKKIKMNKAYIIDPEHGKMVVNLSSLLKEWDGNALGVLEFKKTKCQETSSVGITKWRVFLSYALQVVGGLFFITGIYFLTPDSNVYLPTFLLTLGCIVEIVQKVLIISSMKKFDAYLLNNNIVSGDRYEYYKRSEEYKGIAYSTGLNIILFALISIFIVFITLLNNPLNYPLVIIPIVIAMFEALIYSSYKKKANCEIEIDEQELKFVTFTEEYKKKVNSIHEKAYRFATIDLIKRAVCILTMFGGSILVCYLLNKVNITSMIFNIVMELLLLQYLTPLFKVEDEYLKYQIAKARLNNMFSNRK